MKNKKEMKAYKFAHNHLSHRFEWLNNPDVYKHMNIQYPITLIEVEKWFERAVANTHRIDFVFEDYEQIVSMSGITDIDKANGLAEFYIMVNPELQGKGYGLKTTQFSLNYAFTNFNIHKVYLYTNSFNSRANNLYLKLGFQLEGTLRKHKFKNGEMIDRCIYGLLKDEWSRKSYSTTDINLEF